MQPQGLYTFQFSNSISLLTMQFMFCNKSFVNTKITELNTQLLVVTETEAQSNGTACRSPYTKKAQDKEP
jgi:hypothetical protein